MKSMADDIEALASKVNRQDLKGQSLLAAEGEARIRREERQEATERDALAGKPYDFQEWSPQERKDDAVNSAYARQTDDRGGRRFRKQDIMLPK